jgi:hypothetical protein
MSIFGITIASAISLVISLIGFVIGMRVAKERADRAMLRELYQEIYVHVRDMRDAAKGANPKDWSDYKLVGKCARCFGWSVGARRTVGIVFKASWSGTSRRRARNLDGRLFVSESNAQWKARSRSNDCRAGSNKTINGVDIG